MVHSGAQRAKDREANGQVRNLQKESPAQPAEGAHYRRWTRILRVSLIMPFSRFGIFVFLSSMEDFISWKPGLQDSAEPGIEGEIRSGQAPPQADAAALHAHESSHEERLVMTRVRLDLESLRILLQRINKREKMKRDGNARRLMMQVSVLAVVSFVFKAIHNCY